MYTIAGPEFGSERGEITIVRKALYGLNLQEQLSGHYLPRKLHGIRLPKHFMRERSDVEYISRNIFFYFFVKYGVGQ